jgi:hypothetical protein
MSVSLKQSIVGVAFAGALLLAGPVSLTFAHHGGAGEWQQQNLIGPIRVVATSLEFRFPHPQFHGEVTKPNGQVEPWVFVLRPTPVGLREEGWSRSTIKPGDVLTVTYNPHLAAARVGIVRRLLVNGEFIPIESGDEKCRTVTTPYRSCSDVR